MSAFVGDNIAKLSENTPWYKGPTVLPLNALVEPRNRKLPSVSHPGCLLISGIGTVPVGRIETGVMKKGMKVSHAPTSR